MAELDGSRGEWSAVLAALIEQRGVPRLDVDRGQFDQPLRSEVRDDVLLDHLFVADPRSDLNLGLHAFDPDREEVGERRAGWRDVRSALHTGERFVQRGLRILLRGEAGDLLLSALALRIESEVEPVAPRAASRSGLPNRAFYACESTSSLINPWTLCGHGSELYRLKQYRIRSDNAVSWANTGAGCEDRTRHLMITSQALYQLS